MAAHLMSPLNATSYQNLELETGDPKFNIRSSLSSVLWHIRDFGEVFDSEKSHSIIKKSQASSSESPAKDLKGLVQQIRSAGSQLVEYVKLPHQQLKSVENLQKRLMLCGQWLEAESSFKGQLRDAKAVSKGNVPGVAPPSVEEAEQQVYISILRNPACMDLIKKELFGLAKRISTHESVSCLSQDVQVRQIKALLGHRIDPSWLDRIIRDESRKGVADRKSYDELLALWYELSLVEMKVIQFRDVLYPLTSIVMRIRALQANIDERIRSVDAGMAHVNGSVEPKIDPLEAPMVINLNIEDQARCNKKKEKLERAMTSINKLMEKIVKSSQEKLELFEGVLKASSLLNQIIDGNLKGTRIYHIADLMTSETEELTRDPDYVSCFSNVKTIVREQEKCFEKRLEELSIQIKEDCIEYRNILWSHWSPLLLSFREMQVKAELLQQAASLKPVLRTRKFEYNVVSDEYRKINDLPVDEARKIDLSLRTKRAEIDRCHFIPDLAFPKSPQILIENEHLQTHVVCFEQELDSLAQEVRVKKKEELDLLQQRGFDDLYALRTQTQEAEKRLVIISNKVAECLSASGVAVLGEVVDKDEDGVDIAREVSEHPEEYLSDFAVTSEVPIVAASTVPQFFNLSWWSRTQSN